MPRQVCCFTLTYNEISTFIFKSIFLFFLNDKKTIANVYIFIFYINNTRVHYANVKNYTILCYAKSY